MKSQNLVLISGKVKEVKHSQAGTHITILTQNDFPEKNGSVYVQQNEVIVPESELAQKCLSLKENDRVYAEGKIMTIEALNGNSAQIKDYSKCVYASKIERL